MCQCVFDGGVIVSVYDSMTLWLCQCVSVGVSVLPYMTGIVSVYVSVSSLNESGMCVYMSL